MSTAGRLLIVAVLLTAATIAAVAGRAGTAPPFAAQAPARVVLHADYADSLIAARMATAMTGEMSAGADARSVGGPVAVPPNSDAAGAWLAAATRALLTAVTVEPAYVETGRFVADEADALGYGVALHAGEMLRVELAGGAPYFIDVYDAAPAADASQPLRPLAARGHAASLEYEADRDRTVVIRVQPRLGRTEDYTLTIEVGAALIFPVVAHDRTAIVSHYFDARDDGARLHRAIDIHAPAGTPVLAAAAGVIERVDHTPIGGRVIWLREPATNRTHYYAHLASQLVRPGDVVEAGDVIGTVGNTGNAIETAPHLHFAVQRHGVTVNPLRYLRDGALSVRGDGAHAASAASPSTPAAGNNGEVARAPRPTTPADPAADAATDPPALRTFARTHVGGVALRPHSGTAGPVTTLAADTELRVLARSGRLVRVRTSDGREGFVADWTLRAAR